MSSRYVVAVTGGIASGKTSVTHAFAALGIPVADADIAARDVVAPGTQGLAEIVKQLGEQVLHPDGTLNRALVRELVFNNPQARTDLESITHPRVREQLATQAQSAIGPYVILAIPLLAEIGGRQAYPWIDRILVVDVPRATQLERLLQRDEITRELAERMLDAQAPRAQRLAIADDILVNTGTLSELSEHVAALHAQYLQFAAQRSAELAT